MNSYLEMLLLCPSSDYGDLYRVLPTELGVLQKHDLILQRHAKIPVTGIPELSVAEFVTLCQDWMDVDVIPGAEVTKDDLLRILLGVQDKTGVDLYSNPDFLLALSPMERTMVKESLLESILKIPANVRTNIQQRRDLFLKHMQNTKINPTALDHIIRTELDKTDLSILGKMAGLSNSNHLEQDLYQYVLDNPLSATAEVILGTFGIQGYKDIKLENLIAEGVYPKLKGGFISIVENAVYYNLHGQYYKKELSNGITEHNTEA